MDDRILATDRFGQHAWIAEITEHLPVRGPGDRPALQHGDGFTARGQGGGDTAAEHPGGTGDQNSHHRLLVVGAEPVRGAIARADLFPCSHRVAHRARALRSTLEACRISTGSQSFNSTAAMGTPATWRTCAVSAAGASGEPEQRPSRAWGTITATACWVRAGPGVQQVSQAALDPQPPLVIEAAGIAGAVPARRDGTGLLGGPQSVVAALGVRALLQDLAEHLRC